MPVHDWTRVNAGTFHHLHSSWITHLSEALNDGVLPDGYYAMAEQHARSAIPDVLTLATPGDQPLEPPSGAVAVAEAPPQVKLKMEIDETAHYRLARRTLSIRHTTGHRMIALLEIVSPGNKDRQKSVEDFVDKAVAALDHHLHLLIVDLFPPGPSDPHGIHGAIWDVLGGQAYEPPKNAPLTLASYTANGLPEAYVEPFSLGATLPDMPLFLDRGFYVNVPLESTYVAAYRGVPEYWRKVVEGASA